MRTVLGQLCVPFGPSSASFASPSPHLAALSKRLCLGHAVPQRLHTKEEIDEGGEGKSERNTQQGARAHNLEGAGMDVRQEMDVEALQGAEHTSKGEQATCEEIEGTG